MSIHPCSPGNGFDNKDDFPPADTPDQADNASSTKPPIDNSEAKSLIDRLFEEKEQKESKEQIKIPIALLLPKLADQEFFRQHFRSLIPEPALINHGEDTKKLHKLWMILHIETEHRYRYEFSATDLKITLANDDSKRMLKQHLKQSGFSGDIIEQILSLTPEHVSVRKF